MFIGMIPGSFQFKIKIYGIEQQEVCSELCGFGNASAEILSFFSFSLRVMYYPKQKQKNKNAFSLTLTSKMGGNQKSWHADTKWKAPIHPHENYFRIPNNPKSNLKSNPQ